MSCAEAQEKLRGFLEDLLPEKDRQNVRAHLLSCSLCRDFAERLGTFASDFKQLARVALPPEFGEKIRLAFQKPEEKAPPQIPWQLKVLGPALIILALMGLGAAQIGRWVRWVEKKESKLTMAPNAAIIMEELKQIDAMLSRQTRSAPNKLNAGAAETKAPVVADMRPLHWHVRLKDPAGRAAVNELIHQAKAQIHFESGDAAIFTLPPDTAREFVSGLLRFPAASTKGSIQNMDNFPQPGNPVRISLVFSDSAQPEFHYWIFRFTLANRFIFLEEFQKEGIKILHQSAEFFIIESTPTAFEALKEDIGNFHGLLVDWGWDTAEAAAAGKPERAFIYIAEG